jgi:hypothetical protein
LRISVDVSEVDPNVTISPAACHVVPGRQPVALEQHHVRPVPMLCKVVGHRAELPMMRAAADDDDARAIGAACVASAARWTTALPPVQGAAAVAAW